MTNYQQRWVEILDRQFNLVSESPEDDYWLELVRFLDFILQEEPYRPYTARLRREFQDWVSNYKTFLAEQVETAVQIREELVESYPELDDSDIDKPTAIVDTIDVGIGDPYFQSLAYFDLLVERVRQNGATIWPRSGRFSESDSTESAELNRLILQKILSLPEESRPEYILLEAQYLSETHSRLRNEFIGNCRVWPPASLDYLLELRSEMNPVPQRYSSATEWSFAKTEGAKRNIIGGPLDSDTCRAMLRRVHERIRADLGTHLAHFELVQRYKARCMFYDRERLINLVKNTEHQKEDALTRDLALYLFDNGVSTYYRVLQGVHEYDLINPSIIVEAKQYQGNQSRSYLIKGVSQLHAYANGLESEGSTVRELYYVIFRLGGPLYDWPKEIEMNRWTIYPVTIDIAPSKESGSKQRKVRAISPEEIYGTIENEVEKSLE